MEDESLEARLARLERLVEDLQRRVPAAPPEVAREDLAARPRVHAAIQPPPAEAVPAPAPVRRDPEPVARPAWMPEEPAGVFAWDGQTWLNRLGIALLLLGVALLFRYSIDRGWLTPGVRVGFGAAVGAVLTVAGLRMDERRRFASVLLGGGIAAFYITGWAAFNLYALVGYTLAFVGMVAITTGAFSLALWRGQPALAILGAVGGLGTPLILGITYASPRGLAFYTSAVLGWTVVPYLRRGWRSVLWTSMTLGWTLLASYTYAVNYGPRAGIHPPDSRVWMQGAAVFAWLLLGVLPLARRALAVRAQADAREDHRPRERRWREGDALHWYGIALVPPALLILTTGFAWRMQPEAWGALAIGVAAAYALAAWGLLRVDGRLSRVILFSAAVLLTTGCFGALEGEALLTALAAQALVLHLLARQGAGRAIRGLAHKAYVVLGLWVVFRLADGGDPSLRRMLADLAVIGSVFAASYLLRDRNETLAYRLFAHVGILGWAWRELAELPGGQGYATIVWGGWGLVLLLTALRQGWPLVEKVAICTLLATVAKLFLVDLSRLDPLFRVLLFLGFGAVFLYLSYSLSGAWSRGRREPAEPAGRDA